MSKLNPQKATAYVGPGVLRKGGKITPVPNGPLIKKKGPYAGSTLKSGGAIKKAQGGEKVIKGSRPKMGIFRTTKERTTSGGLLEPFKYKTESIDTTGYSKGRANYKLKTEEGEGDKTGSKVKSSKSKTVSKKQVPGILKSLNKAKDGNMIKRADGSYSKRGLWDNIRANKGSGKKPTAEMLKQERKIKAKSKK
jgi:hypothetical protein